MTMAAAVIRSSGNHCFLTCIASSGCDPLETVSVPHFSLSFSFHFCSAIFSLRET